jgi:hypothetical protein
MENKTENNTNYDPHITAAETAARIEREGGNFKKPPVNEGDIDTTSGYTVDREGLTNNFAIEPEMYVEEPGDLREEIEEEKAERAEELEEINSEDKDGKGKGVGVI